LSSKSGLKTFNRKKEGCIVKAGPEEGGQFKGEGERVLQFQEMASLMKGNVGPGGGTFGEIHGDEPSGRKEGKK